MIPPPREKLHYNNAVHGARWQCGAAEVQEKLELRRIEYDRLFPIERTNWKEGLADQKYLKTNRKFDSFGGSKKTRFKKSRLNISRFKPAF